MSRAAASVTPGPFRSVLPLLISCCVARLAVIDCIYFAMVTMTTVGYGDNPTLRQEMRLFTLFFGFVGVTVVAGSINVRAQRCARSTHFRSLMGCAASGRGRAG